MHILLIHISFLYYLLIPIASARDLLLKKVKKMGELRQAEVDKFDSKIVEGYVGVLVVLC